MTSWHGSQIFGDLEISYNIPVLLYMRHFVSCYLFLYYGLRE